MFMRPWLFVLAVLLIIPLSKAELVYWDNYVNLDDKRFNVTFVYDKPIENSDYFVFALARGITVIADDKNLERHSFFVRLIRIFSVPILNNLPKLF